MAKVNTRINGRETRGEKLVLQLLERSLPDSWTIWHDHYVPGVKCEFDLILFHPKHGILVGEIKDWHISNLEKIDARFVDFRAHRSLETKLLPHIQALENSFSLRDHLKRNAGLSSVRGQHKGKLPFPVNVFAVLTNISQQDVASKRLERFFASPQYWFSDMLGSPGCDFEQSLISVKQTGTNFKCDLSSKQSTEVKRWIGDQVLLTVLDATEKEISPMSHSAPVMRSQPGCLLFIVDESGSMDEVIPDTGFTKAQFVADVLNRTLSNILAECSKAGGVLHYFDIGIIAYNGDGGRVHNGLKGELANRGLLNSTTDIDANYLRIEERPKLIPDGHGGFVSRNKKFTIWFEPNAIGNTPMCAALEAAYSELERWCKTHPKSFPPIVIHITDGASTDGDPEANAEKIKALKTDDGNCLLLNLHVSGKDATRVLYPVTEPSVSDPFAGQLFRMSSCLPLPLIERALARGLAVSTESRGFVFNANVEDVTKFFEVGTPDNIRHDDTEETQ